MDSKEVIDICLRKGVNWHISQFIPNSVYVAILGHYIEFYESQNEIHIQFEKISNPYKHITHLIFNKSSEFYEPLIKAYNIAIYKAKPIQ